MFLNLMNIVFMDLQSSVPISLILIILSEVSAEVKEKTKYTLTSVRINNESMI